LAGPAKEITSFLPLFLLLGCFGLATKRACRKKNYLLASHKVGRAKKERERGGEDETKKNKSLEKRF